MSLNQLIQSFMKLVIPSSPELLPNVQGQGAEDFAEMVKFSREVWTVTGEHFNLFSAMRSFPIGVPSLMVSVAPIKDPLGLPQQVDVSSPFTALGLWILLTVLGTILGVLYFDLVSRAALNNKLDLREAFTQWPQKIIKILLLALLWYVLIIALSIPFTCLITMLFASGVMVSRFAMLFAITMGIWLLMPLLFSPHGIFANHRNVWASVKDSIRLVRFTLPSTSLFILVALVLSEGLDLLWRIPPETSWLSLVGIGGHAFVSTGLLAASFVFYRDASLWVDRVLQQLKPMSDRSV